MEANHMAQTALSVMLNTFSHKSSDRVPYSFAAEQPILDGLDALYGGPSWRDKLERFMSSPMAVDTIQERPISATHARDGMGAIWRMDQLPWHLETPPLAMASLEGYDFPPDEQYTGPIRRDKPAALAKIAAAPDMFHMISMGWGLFEHTWRMRGFENMLSDVVLDEAFYEALVDRLTGLYLAMLRELRDVPAQAVMFGDDWGEQRGVIIGPARFRRLLKPYWRRVYDEVHSQGKLAVSHCCGSMVDIMRDIIEMGLDALESVQPEAAGMQPERLKAEFGRDITFYGCLGTQWLLPFGRPDQIRDEVIRLRDIMGKDGGYILAPAKPLLTETPVENAAALVEALCTLNS